MAGVLIDGCAMETGTSSTETIRHGQGLRTDGEGKGLGHELEGAPGNRGWIQTHHVYHACFRVPRT